MASVPDELKTEILSRLPIKSLVRFRCVCKSWLQLFTTDLHFIKLHQNRSTKFNTNTRIITCEAGEGNIKIYPGEYTTSLDDDGEAIELEFPIDFSHKVVGYSNGILCITNRLYNVYLWNPSTREHHIIRSFRHSLARSRIDAYQYSLFGFGFHQGTNEYKVLRIGYSCSASSVFSDVIVYTLGTSSWRNLGRIPYHIAQHKSSNALVNGALHWIVEADVVSFDIKNEVFQKISLPDNLYTNDYTVGELDGLLCVFCYDFGKRVDMWIMEEYGVVKSWTKQFRLEGSMEMSDKYLTLPNIGKNGELLVRMNSRQLFLYDNKNNLIKQIINITPQSCQAFTYAGSLVSPRVVDKVWYNKEKSELEEIQRKQKSHDH